MSSAASAGPLATTGHWLWSAHMASSMDELQALHAELTAERQQREEALEEVRELREALRVAQAECAATQALRERAESADSAQRALTVALSECAEARAQLANAREESAVLLEALRQAEADLRPLLVRVAALEVESDASAQSSLEQGAHAAALHARLAEELAQAQVTACEERVRAHAAEAAARRARRAANGAAAAALRSFSAQRSLVADCCGLAASLKVDQPAPVEAPQELRPPRPEETTALRVLLERLPALKGAPRDAVHALTASVRMMLLPAGASASASLLPASGMLARLSPDGTAVASIEIGGELEDDATHAALTRRAPQPCAAVCDSTLFVFEARALDTLWQAHPGGMAAAMQRRDVAGEDAPVSTLELASGGMRSQLQHGHAAVAAAHAALSRAIPEPPQPPSQLPAPAVEVPSPFAARVARIDDLLARLDSLGAGRATL